MADAFGSLRTPAASQRFGELYSAQNGVDPPGLVSQWQPNKPIIPVPSVHHQQQQQLIHQFQPLREEREKFFDEQRQTLQLLQQHHTEQMQRLEQIITSYRLQLSQTTTTTDSSIQIAQPTSDAIENDTESPEKSPQPQEHALLGVISSTTAIPFLHPDECKHKQLQQCDLPQCRPVIVRYFKNADITTARVVICGSFHPFKLKFIQHFLDRNGLQLNSSSRHASLSSDVFEWMVGQIRLGKWYSVLYRVRRATSAPCGSAEPSIAFHHCHPSRHARHAPGQAMQRHQLVTSPLFVHQKSVDGSTHCNRPKRGDVGDEWTTLHSPH